MTNITPKRTSEAWRSYTVRTRSWQAIIEFYRDLISKGWPMLPMLHLVECITASAVAAEIHGATSMADLLLSDSEDFRIGDSTLRVSYQADKQTFHFFHHSFSGHDDLKVCAEAEALHTLSLFLKLKYGVLFEVPKT